MGKHAKYTNEQGFTYIVWLPDERTQPKHGIPISVDFEHVAETFRLETDVALKLQNVFHAQRIYTPQEFNRPGVYDIARNVLRPTFGPKATRLANDIVNYVRNMRQE